MALVGNFGSQVDKLRSHVIKSRLASSIHFCDHDCFHKEINEMKQIDMRNEQQMKVTKEYDSQTLVLTQTM